MKVDIAILISACSVAFAIFTGIISIKREQSKGDRKEAAEMTTVIVKLENIGSGITEIKAEMKNLKADIQDLRERLIIAEQSTKSAHHRIDEMVGGSQREGP